MGTTTRSRSWLFTTLLLLGALVQACTNQSGSSGPSHPAGQTGHADTTAQIRVQVSPHKAAVGLGEVLGITVLVTNLNGRPLEGRHVQLGITNAQAGRLTEVDGFTDVDGKFVSFLFCETDSAPEITAFVEGATDSRTVTCGTGGTTTATGTGTGIPPTTPPTP